MAKIPFSIDYRPQIESGEYKVETGDGRSVRIISWDKKVFGGRTEIVALVPTSEGNTETVQLYCPDGTLIVSSWNEKFKLFIVTPEPELTEWQRFISACLQKHGLLDSVSDRIAKESAAELLTLAEREIVNRVAKECYKEDFCIEDTVKFNEGYKLGKEVALKNLPRWKKFAPNINDPFLEQQICAELKNSVMRVDDGGYCWIISRKELNKLPKEGESRE